MTNRTPITILSSSIALALLSACGGGGGTKPSPPPAPTTTCSEKVGVSPYTSSTTDGAPTSDTTCPSGQTLVTAGSSFVRTTVTYSCASPTSTSQNPTASSSNQTVVTQSKVCTTPPPPVPVACAGVSGKSDQYACRTGFDKVQQSGQTGAGVVMGAIEPGINPTSQGLAGKPIEVFLGGIASDASVNYHGSGVANILLGQADIVPDSTGAANNNTGGLLPDLAKLVVSPGVSGPIIDNFVNQGARIINWSGADPVSYGESGDLDIVQPYLVIFDYAMDRGLVLIMAAGNNGKINPSATASVPSYDAKLLNATITAVAGDPNTLANPASAALASYSNRCGVAADYCLTAPGTVWIPSDTTTGAGFNFNGTSIATPIVSATAAATWNQFSFFSAWQMRETLFTTATDLGAIGVDSVFGHGLVNAEKAMKGPGALRQNWDAIVNSGSFTFGNDISGVGALNKSGAGTLTLTGFNTFSGGLNVTGGELALANSRNTSNASVSGSGTLSGFGSVGSLNNSSTVAVNGGNLAVNGNFVQTGDNALLSVAVNQTLAITGTATLDGKFSLKVPDTYVVSGTIAPALTAANGINGVFDSTASSSALFALTATYTTNNLNVALNRLSATSVIASTSSSTFADAQRLDSLFNTLDTAVQSGASPAALAAAARLQSAETAQQLSVAADSLSGRVYANQAVLVAQSDAFDRRRALAQFATSQTGVVSANAAIGTGSFGGQSRNTIGQQVNASAELDAGWKLGASTGVEHGFISASNGQTETTTQRIDLMAAKPMSESTTALLSLSKADSENETIRSLMLPGQSFQVAGEQDVDLTTLRAGFQTKTGSWLLSAGMSAQHMAMNDLREKGSTGLELAIDGQSDTAFSADVGIARSWQFTGGNWNKSFLMSADVQQVLSGNLTNMNASYTGADMNFGINQADADGLFASYLMSFSASRGNTVILFDAQASPTDKSANAVHLSWVKAF